MSLKDIKTKIKSVGRTRKVTKAMEAVSAVKMRKSQQRALTSRPYARASLFVLEKITTSLSKVSHPLTEHRPVKKAAVILMTSDKGLCGVLNVGVLKNCEEKCVEELSEFGLKSEDIDIIAYGKKGAEYYERRGHNVVKRFENISDDVSIEDLKETADTVSQAFEDGTYDRVYVAYTGFKSTFEQTPRFHQLLPLRRETLRKIVKFIVPREGKFAEEEAKEPPAFYTVEPSAVDVIKTLIPRLVSVMLYHALLELKASEHSARMVAMKNASDKSLEISKTLTRKFNKARQSIITREVSEIVGGIEALATS